MVKLFPVGWLELSVGWLELSVGWLELLVGWLGLLVGWLAEVEVTKDRSRNVGLLPARRKNFGWLGQK